MSRRKKHKKVTTVWKGIFGEKHIETRWVPEGSGCGATAFGILFLILLLRGCG